MPQVQDFNVSSLHHEGEPAILILTTSAFNDLELFYPYYRFSEEGYRVDVASPSGGKITGKGRNEFHSSLALKNLKLEDYTLLYIPGGDAPSILSHQEEAIKWVRRFAASGRPIAFICNGARLLVAADLVRRKRLAAWPELEKEITDAGGCFVNAPVVEDGEFISARWAGDLPIHLKTILTHVRTLTRETTLLPAFHLSA